MTTAYTLGRYLKPFAVLALAAPLLGASGTKVRIIQTNSAGDAVTLIDPATNKGFISATRPKARLTWRMRKRWR